MMEDGYVFRVVRELNRGPGQRSRYRKKTRGWFGSKYNVMEKNS
jgi:hypothetical protein